LQAVGVRKGKNLTSKKTPQEMDSPCGVDEAWKHQPVMQEMLTLIDEAQVSLRAMSM
jgi:hypothetical protein